MNSTVLLGVFIVIVFAFFIFRSRYWNGINKIKKDLRDKKIDEKEAKYKMVKLNFSVLVPIIGLVLTILIPFLTSGTFRDPIRDWFTLNEENEHKSENPLLVTAMPPTDFRVIVDNAPILSQPYQESPVSTSVAKYEMLVIVGSTLNSHGDRWYIIENGGWIHSDNVTLMLHDALDELDEETVIILDVVGKSRADADNVLREQGFTVNIAEGFSDTVLEGDVISQYPAAGDSASRGTPVIINVSRGRDTVVSLSIETYPTRTNFYTGQSVDVDGLTLTARWASGRTTIIDFGFEVSPSTLNTVGTQTITVTYDGRSTTLEVTVEVPPTRAGQQPAPGGQGGEMIPRPPEIPLGEGESPAFGTWGNCVSCGVYTNFITWHPIHVEHQCRPCFIIVFPEYAGEQ